MQYEHAKSQPVRRNLSDDLIPRFREMVARGALVPGSRINEVHLSKALAVSRTPLREALNQLAAEGDVMQVPRRGFFVCPLTVEEAAEIYPIRAYLDPEALRLAGVPDEARLGRLDKLNESIAATKSVPRRIELENAWFRTLHETCPNQTLLHLIEQFMRRTARYEMVSMAESETIRQGTNTRTEVASALRDGDLDRACNLLRAGLLRGKDPVITWLLANPSSSDI